MIHYDLPSSQRLLIYVIFFLYLFYEAKRLHTYMCVQLKYGTPFIFRDEATHHRGLYLELCFMETHGQ